MQYAPPHLTIAAVSPLSVRQLPSMGSAAKARRECGGRESERGECAFDRHVVSSQESPECVAEAWPMRAVDVYVSYWALERGASDVCGRCERRNGVGKGEIAGGDVGRSQQCETAILHPRCPTELPFAAAKRRTSEPSPFRSFPQTSQTRSPKAPFAQDKCRGLRTLFWRKRRQSLRTNVTFSPTRYSVTLPSSIVTFWSFTQAP